MCSVVCNVVCGVSLTVLLPCISQATAAIATYSEPFISSVLSTAFTNAIQGFTVALFAVVAMQVMMVA